MRVLIILMLLLSLFVGIPINGQWATLYGFEFISIPEMIRYETLNYLQIFIWIILLLSHIGLLLLLFIIHEPYFKRLLIYLPILFILSFTALDFFNLFFLIPFIVVWIICLLKARKYNIVKNN